ncbi:MAG: ComEC/Rec2 family competence protein [Acidobacteriota bacterium]
MFAAVLTCVRRDLGPYFVALTFFATGVFLQSADLHSIRDDRIKAIYDSGKIASDETVEVEGVLLRSPEGSIDGSFIRLRAMRLSHNGVPQNVSGDIRLFAVSLGGKFNAEYSTMDLRRGAQIVVTCQLDREERFLNPGVVSHQQMLDQQEIDATAIVKTPASIKVLSANETFDPFGRTFEIREKLVSEFRERFDGPTAGVLTASLLGSKYFLDKHIADIFREGGTFHILVISGLHVTFIGAVLLLFVRLFTRNRLLQFLIASLFLWSFALAVGGQVPVVRASVMFTILAFSYVVNRQGTLLNSLGLCAILLLVWRPDDLFTASFQLTFISVLAIVAAAFPLVEKLRSIGKWIPTRRQPFPPNVPDELRRICEALYWRDDCWKIEAKRQIWSARLFKYAQPRWLSFNAFRSVAVYIFEGVLVSAIVQLSLMPFVIVYFHRISFAGVLLNLWVGILIVIESFAAIVSIALSQISSAMPLPFVYLTEALNWLLVSVPGWFVHGGWGSFRIPAYSGSARLIYLLYLVPVCVFAYALFIWDPFDHRKRKRSTLNKLVQIGALVFPILLAIIIYHPFSAPAADGKLHVDFLDVGQGDSALVTFPDGETMLIDGGGRGRFRTERQDGEEVGQRTFEPDAQRIGEAVVSAFLWEKGYSKIDYILATHADADHIQGLSDIAKNFAIRQAFFGRTPVSDPEFSELADILAQKNIPSVVLARGDAFEIGGVRVKTLYPQPAGSPNEPSDNDHSLVVRLEFGSRKILMTGDIERKAETDLITTPSLLTADVVKVPHHGSKTSSSQAFVDAVQPGVAVISVGRHSIFGHPNPTVVQRWKDRGAALLTTGRSGTVTVITDGKALEVSTFVR